MSPSLPVTVGVKYLRKETLLTFITFPAKKSYTFKNVQEGG